MAKSKSTNGNGMVAASEESTPLLTIMGGNQSQQQQQHVDEEAGGYGASALAPPPAAPPPPPPAQDSPDSNRNNNDDDDDDDDSDVEEGNHQHNDTNADAAADAAMGETSSQTQSTKSGNKQSKNKRRKQNKSNSSESIKSGKTNKSTKTSSSKKKKKHQHDGPQKSIMHLLFDSVRYLAMISSTMMFAMQIVPLVVIGYESTWLQIVVRCYLAIFCLTFLLMECRVLPLLRKLNDYSWVLRGFLYSFIGLIGMEQDLAVKVADIARGTGSWGVLGPDYGTLFSQLFMSITTWIMIGVGVLYTVLGLLCMQGWYEKMEVSHKEKVREYKRRKKREEEFKKQQEDYKKYEKDRREGRGEWYDDLE